VGKPRRPLLGLVAMTATLILLDLFSNGQTLPDQAALDFVLLKNQISGTIELFIAVAIGSVIARGKFLTPAISFLLLIQLISIYTLYQIALPTGQANLFDIVIFNAPFFAISLLVAGLAAWIGAWYYEREFGNVTAAT